MALIFESIYTPGIAQISYLIGDDSAAVAAVIDPRPDCDIYINLARKKSLVITHIFETHIHADFMSGSRELAARLGGVPRIHASGEKSANYDFDVKKIGNEDTFEIGSFQLFARHTPGHTPEHLAYEFSEVGKEAHAVFTGDSLFADSVGRPDLMGDDKTEELIDMLHETLYGYYLNLSDHILIHPCHGAGSACGPSIGNRMVSSIGYERLNNSFLQHPKRSDFRKILLSDETPEPRHYRRLKQVNAKGPKILKHSPIVSPLTPHQFDSLRSRQNVQLLDTRSIFGFSGGHIPGAINIAARDELSVWAGWMLDPEKEVLLILEENQLLEDIVSLLLRVGFIDFAGYLAGGMTQWAIEGLPIQSLPQIDVHDLKNEMNNGFKILDVREDREWKEGHIKNAYHQFAAEFKEDLPEEIDPREDVATYCATGFRAMIAASHLQAHGYEKVRSVPGSIAAWIKAGYPLTKRSK